MSFSQTDKMNDGLQMCDLNWNNDKRKCRFFNLALPLSIMAKIDCFHMSQFDEKTTIMKKNF